MQPRIESGNRVKVSPVTSVSEGDIVFCKVKGKYYIHLVKAVKMDGDKELFLIGNNKGGINGWVSKNGIFGKVVEISE